MKSMQALSAFFGLLLLSTAAAAQAEPPVAELNELGWPFLPGGGGTQAGVSNGGGSEDACQIEGAEVGYYPVECDHHDMSSEDSVDGTVARCTDRTITNDDFNSVCEECFDYHPNPGQHDLAYYLRNANRLNQNCAR